MSKNIIWRGYLYASLVVAIWSGFILVSRMGGTSVLTGFDIVAVRYGTALVILLPVWFIGKSIDIFNRKMFYLTITGGLGYSLLAFSGFKIAPAVHGAMLLPGLLPFEITLFVWLLFGEKPSLFWVVGMTVIAAGVGCLSVEVFHNDSVTWRGDILIFGASICWALYTALARRWNMDPWQITIGVALLTGFIYLPVYVLFLPKQILIAAPMDIALQAFYQGILAVIVQMLFYMRAVAIIGATRLGSLMALVPAISGFAAVPLLGEALSLWLVAGLVLISVGAYIGNKTNLLSLRKKTCPT